MAYFQGRIASFRECFFFIVGTYHKLQVSPLASWRPMVGTMCYLETGHWLQTKDQYCSFPIIRLVLHCLLISCRMLQCAIITSLPVWAQPPMHCHPEFALKSAHNRSSWQTLGCCLWLICPALRKTHFGPRRTACHDEPQKWFVFQFFISP